MLKYFKLLAILLFITPVYADGLIVTPSQVGVAPIGQIPAIANNSTPCTTCVGYTLTANRESAQALPLTTSTALSVTSVSLTAGNWEISGNACWDTGTTTTIQLLLGMISSTQNSISGANSTTQGRLAFNNIVMNGGTTCVTVPRQVIYLSATTTYYLNSYGIFGTSTLNGYGSIIATRIR